MKDLLIALIPYMLVSMVVTGVCAVILFRVFGFFGNGET